MACSGDIPDLGKGLLEQWKGAWENGKAVWQLHHVNRALKRNIQHLKVENGGDLKIFVPLCGKSRDIKWLWEQGFTVVGAEVSEIAVKDFFTENEIKYEASPIEGGPGMLYRSADDRIRLYQCNFYDFSNSVEGRFQYIWDRGSFGSISKGERLKYISVISELMSDNCRMLLEIFDRNNEVDPGQPPFDFPDPEVRQHFNQQFEIEQVDKMKIDDYLDLSDKRYFAYTRFSGCRIYLVKKTPV